VGILFAFLSGLAFALNNILIKKGMKDDESGDNSFFLTVLLNVILLGFAFLIAWQMRGFSFAFSPRAFAFFVLSGLCTTAMGRFTLFASIRQIGPTRASAIKNGSPMFTVLFALLLLGETISQGPALGIAVMLAGILVQGIILFRQKSEADRIDSPDEGAALRLQWFGYLLGIVSAISFGIGQVFRKQGLLLMDDAFFGAFTGALVSLLFVCVYEGVRGQLRTVVRKSFREFNRCYFLAGVMSSLGPLFFFLGSSLTQVSYVSVVAAAEPLLTVLFSKWLLKNEERLTRSVWATVVLVLSGTVLMISTA